MFKWPFSRKAPAPKAEPQVVASGVVERIGSYMSDADWVENRLVLLQSGEQFELVNDFHHGWSAFARVFALTVPGDRIEILGVRNGERVVVAELRNQTLKARLAAAKVPA